MVCFFGDAATEEGVFHESLNFASLMQLPIIFVCENNQYSVDTHIDKRQPKRNLESFGAAHKIYSIVMDGGDVFKIAESFERLLDNCRGGEPIFVVLNTNRSHIHCGIDKEFELENDPLDAAKGYDDTKIKELITNAFNAAEIAPLPTPDMASKYVYA